jgi:asparagine synthase (glutamine-hydrolysing)
MNANPGSNFHPPIVLVSWEPGDNDAQPQLRVGQTSLWRPPASGDWIWSMGYIANRLELLNQLGLQATTDDREILYNLYGCWRDAAARLIAGTFTWMLWDSRRQTLIAARDRMGNYNFYFTHLNGVDWISNRIEPLLEIEALPHNLNPRSVVAQIAGSLPGAGETFYAAVGELEPGGWLRLAVDGRQSGRYWRVEPQPSLKLASDAEYAQALRDLLFQLVLQHAPAGQAAIALSGGLDSTSLAAALRQAAPEYSLVALSWITPELPESDESSLSTLTSRFLEIPSLPIRADLHWTMQSPEGICTHQATPRYNIYTDTWEKTFRVAGGNGSGIIFSGNSGDHLFGGNVFAYPDLLLSGHWLELARQIRRHRERSSTGLSLSQVIRRMLLAPIWQAYTPGWSLHPTPPPAWLQPAYHELYSNNLARRQARRWMLPGRLGRLRMLSHPSLPYSVEAVNRHAEDFGIEYRHPLLDHRLIEFALSLPTDQTFRAGQRKVILRNAMRGLLPAEVLSQEAKVYPIAIAHRGLREREQAKVWRLITNMRAAEMGFVDEIKLRQAYQDYLDKKTDDTLFWHTLTLEDWLRRWF